MKINRAMLVLAVFLAATNAVANNTWYVDGANGNDSNNCKSPQNGCTDGNGHLLTTDQRGQPRPDKRTLRLRHGRV